MGNTVDSLLATPFLILMCILRVGVLKRLYGLRGRVMVRLFCLYLHALICVREPPEGGCSRMGM